MDTNSQSIKLKIQFCSFKAAEFAVQKYHYSKVMPAGKLLKYGVWENDRFIGAVIFGRGANNHLLTQYNLDATQGCELVRIALTKHLTPVTKIVSVCLKLLRKDNPGLQLVVSFADARQNHLGKIYQAGNWVYTGSVQSTPEWFVNGRWMHQRTVNSVRGTIKGLTVKRDGGIRHRYLYALNDTMRQSIARLSKEYPKL